MAAAERVALMSRGWGTQSQENGEQKQKLLVNVLYKPDNIIFSLLNIRPVPRPLQPAIAIVTKTAPKKANNML
jgi:hypothetical protein